MLKYSTVLYKLMTKLNFFTGKMRQLKGKVKENAREKKERKKEFLENKNKAWTVALPTLGAVFLMVIIFVYLNSRPKNTF